MELNVYWRRIIPLAQTSSIAFPFSCSNVPGFLLTYPSAASFRKNFRYHGNFTLVVASTRGNASAMVDGKPVTIGLNAYIKP